MRVPSGRPPARLQQFCLQAARDCWDGCCLRRPGAAQGLAAACCGRGSGCYRAGWPPMAGEDLCARPAMLNMYCVRCSSFPAGYRCRLSSSAYLHRGHGAGSGFGLWTSATRLSVAARCQCWGRAGSREGACPRAWCARVRTVAHWWRTGGGGGEAGQAVHRGGAGAQRPQGGNHRGGRRMGACFMPLFLQSPPPTTCHRHISHSLRRHLLTLTAMHWRRTADSILMPHWLARRFKRVLAGAGSRQCCE